MKVSEERAAKRLENAKRHVVEEVEDYYPVMKRYEVTLRLRDGSRVKGASHNGFDMARGKALRSVMDDLEEVKGEDVYSLPPLYRRSGVGTFEDQVMDCRQYVKEPQSVSLS